MKMLEIAALSNGAHKNQTYHGILPEGWAVIPDGMITENFPFGQAETAEVNGVMTVTQWIPGEVPNSGTLDPTPAQRREEAYNTKTVIEWDGELLTVTKAATLWQYYAAEGSEKAAQLQVLIAAAKEEIRAEYPDEEVSV